MCKKLIYHFDTSLICPLALVNRTKVWMWENIIFDFLKFLLWLFYFHSKCLKKKKREKVNNNKGMAAHSSILTSEIHG